MAKRSMPTLLPILLLIYLAASLIHFIHNAEFLAEYPNLPTSRTRSGVYFAWITMMIVGVGGWTLVSRGYQQIGLLLLAVYAALGLGSLAHYNDQQTHSSRVHRAPLDSPCFHPDADALRTARGFPQASANPSGCHST